MKRSRRKGRRGRRVEGNEKRCRQVSEVRRRSRISGEKGGGGQGDRKKKKKVEDEAKKKEEEKGEEEEMTVSIIWIHQSCTTSATQVAGI